MGADADTYGELATATLTGYDFDGWYTEAEGGEQGNFDNSLSDRRIRSSSVRTLDR